MTQRLLRIDTTKLTDQELEEVLAAVLHVKQHLDEKGVSAYAKLIQKHEIEKCDGALQLDKALLLGN